MAFYLVDEVEDSVNEDVERRASGHQEGSPPPPVVLVVRRNTESVCVSLYTSLDHASDTHGSTLQPIAHTSTLL